MKAVCVWPPMRTKFCTCVATPLEELEMAGASPVNVNPASAMGLLPDVELVDTVYDDELGAISSKALE